MTINVVPAYGRKYTSLTAALKDWDAGKDFKITSGMYAGAYINKEDARDGAVKVNIII